MKLCVAFICLFVGVVFAEIATKFKDKIIDKHNEIRRDAGGSNMNELIWNDDLAKEADAWIGRCRFEHENKGRGENLAFNTRKDDANNIEQSFADWYNETKHYDYQRKRCSSVCGHYTQLVWATTREVGCAYKTCPSLSAFGQNVKDGWIFGCWYTPKGNYNGEFPFLKVGAACEGCWEGQTCDKGLCKGEGKEKCEDKEKDCVMWAAGGSCDSNKPFMERKCRQSCKLCTGGPKKDCKDESPLCAKYGKAQCAANPSFMTPNCMKFCDQCQ